MQTALYIGRFQPFHKGHLEVIQKILSENDRVIIVIGSAEKNFLPKDPLTAGERFQLIDESLQEAGIPSEKYAIIPVRNVNNYALWVNHINIHVPPYQKLYTGSELVKACYLGKYYITKEPIKDGPEIMDLVRETPISGTEVRECILANNNWESLVPPAAGKLLTEWKIRERLKIIQKAVDLTHTNNSY